MNQFSKMAKTTDIKMPISSLRFNLARSDLTGIVSIYNNLRRRAALKVFPYNQAN